MLERDNTVLLFVGGFSFWIVRLVVILPIVPEVGKQVWRDGFEERSFFGPESILGKGASDIFNQIMKVNGPNIGCLKNVGWPQMVSRLAFMRLPCLGCG